MIESPSRTVIISESETAPPPYTDEAEKEPLKTDAEHTDIEVTVFEQKPITSSVRTTIRHLRQTAGFRALWRGVGLALLYNLLHGVIANFIVYTFQFGLFGGVLSYIFVSLGLARVHMAWTHSMIAHQSPKRWFHRLPARRDCRVLLLPTLVYAAAQQATLLLPLAVGFALGVLGPSNHHVHAEMIESGCSKEAAILLLKHAAIPLTYLFVGVAVLFPASVTLTRIEATLLPADMQPIVNFDKAAITGDIDMSARGSSRALFVNAWRSFDRSARLRLIKLYVKMVMAEMSVAFVTAHLLVAEVYMLGMERMHNLWRAGSAQLKLMAIEAHQQRMDGN